MTTKLKIVDAKDCVPGQMVASARVTESEPYPDGDDWLGLPADEMDPGLYRAVEPYNPGVHGEWAADAVFSRLEDEAGDPEGALVHVPADKLQRLQAAMVDCLDSITLYRCVDFLVRVPAGETTDEQSTRIADSGVAFDYDHPAARGEE